LGEPRPPRRLRAGGAASIAILASLLVLAGGASPARAAGYPPLPGGVGDDRELLDNLSAPSIVPGGSGEISFEVTAPSTPPTSLVGVVVELEVYAFNGYPGTGAAPLPIAHAPLLSNTTTSAEDVLVDLGNLTAGASARASVGFATTAATPAGTYAVRTAVSFTESGTAYRLESRGWFNATLWTKATELPNGTATLNLTLLGVSGVVAETGLVVSPSGWNAALAIVAGVGFVLVGLGAWAYFRRSPGSTSGTG
jgi:hypothetical protein